MIPRSVERQYLARELDDFSWLKGLKRKQLRRMVKDLHPRPDLHGPKKEKIWKNQLVAFLLGVYLDGFLFFMDMGSGKTRVILHILSYRKKRGDENATMICVDNEAAIENWVIEIEKYAPDLNYVSLDQGAKTNFELLDEEADIFLIHYPGLRAMCTDLKKEKKTDKVKRRMISTRKIRRVMKKFNGLVLDESTAVMNKASLNFRIAYRISRVADYCFAMTGTPFGKDPMPLWSQFFVVDQGQTLGATLGLYREIFFNKQQGEFGGATYTFKKKRVKKLHKTIRNKSVTYTEDELNDLPKRVHIKRFVTLPAEMDTYYALALNLIRTSKGNFEETKNSFLRMRQVSSGFLGIKNEDTGEKVKIEFPTSPKIDEVMLLIEQIPAKARICIYYEYIWTGNKIAERLKEAKITHTRLWSGQKDKRGAVRNFRKEKGPKVMLVNNHSGASSMNFQIAPYEIFVESPVSPIDRQQAERRIRRPGQKSRKVWIIDIIARSAGANGKYHSVDEQIIDSCERGQNLLQRVLTGEDKI